MALKLDVTHRGLSIKDSYVVVVMPTISTGKDSLEFGVWYKAGAEHEQFMAANYSAPYDLDGNNPFEQAYEHLKTLPEFKNATDC